MVKKGLIIAAGNGSRLSRREGDIPKPLRRVAGLSLIKRIVLSAKKGGITELVIVVGYQKEKIIQALQSDNLGVKIDFVENKEWKKSNGISVLAAEPYLKENFVLLMSDHLFDWNTLASLRQTPLGQNKALLAIDRQIDKIFDWDDATKVVVEENQIRKIGKNLEYYNAVDTGMFLASPELFSVLKEATCDGNVSLSDGIQLLAKKGEMGTFDIGDAFWQDVDTKKSLIHAEKYLLNNCRKITDGAISRHFNRHISLGITRWLIKTPLTANQMTGITTFIGILSAWFAAQGNYGSVLLGALLFKLTSILDGCDGEISKLKMTQSKRGEWLDTLSDNATYLFFMMGVILGLDRLGYPHVRLAGTLAIFGLSMALFVMFYYLVRFTNSGSLVEIQKNFKFSLHFMLKRDFFALLFLALALLGQLHLILWICAVGSNVAWIVLLSSRLGLFKKEQADSISMLS